MSPTSRFYAFASLATVFLLALGASQLGFDARPDLVERTTKAILQKDKAQFERHVDVDRLAESAARELAKVQGLKTPDLREEARRSPLFGARAPQVRPESVGEDLRQQLDRFFLDRRSRAPDSSAPNSPNEPMMSVENGTGKAQLHLKARLSGPQGPVPVDLILQPSPETEEWQLIELREISVGIKKTGRF